MSSNERKENFDGSHGVKSEIQSELNTELQIKESPSMEPRVETWGDREETIAAITPQEHLNSVTTKATYEPSPTTAAVPAAPIPTDPGSGQTQPIRTENFLWNPEKDSFEVASNGVSEHEQIASKNDFEVATYEPSPTAAATPAAPTPANPGPQPIHTENIRSSPEKDSFEIASNGGSEHGQIASKNDFEVQNPAKKRVFLPSVQKFLGFKEPGTFSRPVKRGRFSFSSDSRIGRMNNFGPISADEIFPSRSESKETSASMVGLFDDAKGDKTSDGMFDDAEGDKTFDFEIYKRLATSAPTIRPDLVAAILGSPTESYASGKPAPTSSSNFEDATGDHQERRKTVNKKRKKKSTEKERIAAVGILNGEVDLLRILPRDDCHFLGKVCFIFTLRQLELVLAEYADAQDSSSRQGAREVLTRKLKENGRMIYESKEILTNSTNQNGQGHSTTISLSTQTELAYEKERNTETFESEGPPIANETSEDKPSKDIFVAEKLEAWKASIRTWKQRSETECEDQFPLLDGPLSVFFPVGTLQFMESINVRILFDFLCLKKTESGLVVEMFRAWRKKSGLKDLNLLPLAKHLTGINARIEASLISKLDVEKDFTKWITGPMVVLSGAAKEFLVDHSKFFSGTQFIETKTKNLADQFASWRSKTGLPALRGSGNVAMISAWKTQVKDELELEKSEGKVLPEEEIVDEVESISETTSLGTSKKVNYGQRKRKRVEAPKADANSVSQTAYQALDSTSFFSEFFHDERKMAMFKSVGITTAREFLDAGKGKNSDLLKALLRFKSEHNKGKEIQIPSCVSLLYDWAARMKRRINDIENGANDVVRKVLDKDRTSKGNRSWKKKSQSINPFDALSKPSKEFLLASMNISTASKFLATRTTDIANAFIKWRKDRGMPALKGLGAVASISGWKKLVRNKAASVGDLTLAELNRSRNTKILVGENETTLQQAESTTMELRNRLRPLDKELNAATHYMASECKNILSVLSCTNNDVFHFELETRKDQSKGNKMYLRHLGSDPGTAFGLTDVRVKNERESIAVRTNLDQKLNKISGRKSYDSVTHGMVELSYPTYDPGVQQQDDSGFSLEEVIRTFVLQNELPHRDTSKIKTFQGSSDGCAQSKLEVVEPDKMFNVFEVLRNGKKVYMLHLVNPIERGQSIELRCLPLNAFDMPFTGDESGKALRDLIRNRLQKLPVALLLEVLTFLKAEVAALVSKHFDLAMNGVDFPVKNETQCSYSSLTTMQLVIARRRVHWVAVKIYENLRISSTDLVTRNVSTDILWTKLFIDKFLDHPSSKSMILESIRGEIRQEIRYEFGNREFKGFASTMDIWCPLATQLFDKIVDLFSRLISIHGDAFIGKNLTSELSSSVSETISELRKLSDGSQSSDGSDLSKIALKYEDSTIHESIYFPSFEDIKQKTFLQPYMDAMVLCNEPVSMLDSAKEVRIVATKRVSEWNKNEQTRFKDLRDTKTLSGNNIDVRWYVDTQILAVALSAFRSGTFICAPEDRGEILSSIELRILEAANQGLVEKSSEAVAQKDLEIQQRAANSVLQSILQKSFRPSSRTPSSTPFFFGLIWPLLRDEGWKLIAGDTPTNISFVPPETGGIAYRAHRQKDSLAKQREQLARETSSFGLGYIPRLTKRLLIECFKKNEAKTIPHEVSSSPSTKGVLDKFESFLLLNVEGFGDSKTVNERTKIKNIVLEIILLFNKLAPQTFEKEDEIHLSEGKQWCDVLDWRYLFKFLIIIPKILKEANLPSHQYQHTICVVQELLLFLSNNHQELFLECLQLPNEEYHSESNFSSRLPLQIKHYSPTNLNLDLGNALKNQKPEEESVETIHAEDRVDLTDFVSIVMSQTIIGRSTVEGRYPVGHPFLVCRHCLGRNGGKYFYGSYDSIATATSIIEKHILRCVEIDEKVKQEVASAKINHSEQRKNLPFGAQGAYFVRLYDRMKSMTQGYNQSEPDNNDYSIRISSHDKKSHAAKSMVVEDYSNVSRTFDSHLDVMDFVQSVEPWKSKKLLLERTSKYYDCLEYEGKLSSTKRNSLAFSSESIYSKLASRI